MVLTKVAFEGLAVVSDFSVDKALYYAEVFKKCQWLQAVNGITTYHPLTPIKKKRSNFKCQLLTLVRVQYKVSDYLFLLTLQMLRQVSAKAPKCEDFCKPSKPCHVGIY